MSNTISTAFQQIYNHPIARPAAAFATIAVALIALKVLGVAILSATGAGALTAATLAALYIVMPPRAVFIEEAIRIDINNYLKEKGINDELTPAKQMKIFSLKGQKWVGFSLTDRTKDLQIYLGFKLTSSSNEVEKFRFSEMSSLKEERTRWARTLDGWKSYGSSPLSLEDFNILCNHITQRQTRPRR